MKNLIENQAEDVIFYHYRKFDAEDIKLTTLALELLLVNHNLERKHILQLHDALLFLLAYPANERIHQLANSCMQLLVQTVIKIVKNKPDAFYNSGITGSHVCAQFGLILNKILLDENLETLELNSVDGHSSELVGKLTFTLDSVEQELMPNDAGYFNKWQKRYLPKLKNKQHLLDYYINACMQMQGSIAYKENVFATFQLYTQFCLDEKLLGMSNGRMPFGKLYTHPNGIQKKSTIAEVFSQGKPKTFSLKSNDQNLLVRLARGAMASLLRETDTFTYAQESETELFDMGKGVCIALYYMVPEQKFAMQSYIGYLVFKNGVPMAYGGCWLFAFQAAFGVNVLPPFRGGESSNVVGQLLRLYHHRFGITQFTVDPYQIGKGNSDGIKSGAFWFYYKLGFRPMDNTHAHLAQSEIEKMNADKNYRSPSKILIKLANAEIYWQVETNKKTYFSLLPIADKIGLHVTNNFHGNRELALQHAAKKYQKIFKKKIAPANFLNRLLTKLDTLSAFEKLNKTDLEKVVDAYSSKSTSEAAAHNQLQKVKAFWKLLG